jgi:RNA polymerase sigma factor (sigma-70 family)
MKELFLKLVNENQGIIHKISIIYARSIREREDLVQEIILQLWKSFPGYKGNSKFSTWMYRVAINTALMTYREKSYDLNRAQSIAEMKNKYDDYFSKSTQENIISLYMAIDQLGPVDKAIIILYLEGNNYKEIADILGLSVSNVGVRINRTKIQLKKIVDYESVG